MYFFLSTDGFQRVLKKLLCLNWFLFILMNRTSGSEFNLVTSINISYLIRFYSIFILHYKVCQTKVFNVRLP